MILITGSSGFIGTNLVKHLIHKKINFYGVDIKKNNYINFKNFSRLDLSKQEKIKKLFKKIKPQIVIHLAAVSGVNMCNQNNNLAYKNNVQATFNVLMASKEFKCKKVLIASSFAAEKFYTNPSFYAYTKKTCEDMSKMFKNNYNLKVSVLRFSNVYGAYSLHKSSAIHQMMRCLKKNKLFKIHGTGKQLRDFIYVEDLLKKINKIYKKNLKKNFYNINTNKLNSINEIVKILNSFSNKTLKTKHVKAPVGYDVSFFKKAKVRRNANLILNLKKTFNWYNSKKL